MGADDFPPIGAPVEVCLDRGPWIPGTVTAHDPGHGFEVHLASGGFSHTANSRCQWRLPQPPPAAPACEVCGRVRGLFEVWLGRGDDLVSLNVCDECLPPIRAAGGHVQRKGVLFW